MEKHDCRRLPEDSTHHEKLKFYNLQTNIYKNILTRLGFKRRLFFPPVQHRNNLFTRRVESK